MKNVVIFCMIVIVALFPSLLHGVYASNVVSTITTGFGPIATTFNPQNGFVYVANSCGNDIKCNSNGTLSVISGTSVITTMPIGNVWQLANITFDPKNGYVYLIVWGAGSNNYASMFVISGTSVIATIPFNGGPFASAVDPSNGYVYVVSYGTSPSYSGSVSVISGTSVIATIPVGTTPQAIAFDPANGYVYVGNCQPLDAGSGYFAGSVSVISGTSVVANINKIGNGNCPDTMTFDPSNGFVYVANAGSPNYSNSVSIINNTSVIADIHHGGEVGPSTIAFDPVNDYVYVADYEGGLIYVINGTTEIAKINNGPDQPDAITVDPTNGYVYIASYSSSPVSIINGTSVINTIPVGIHQKSMVLDSTNDYLYVANQQSGTVSIISLTTETNTQPPSNTPNQSSPTTTNPMVNISVTTDKSSYKVGDSINISGLIQPFQTGNTVYIRIANSTNNQVYASSINPAVDGKFIASVTVSCPKVPTSCQWNTNQNYTVAAQYQPSIQAWVATTTFSIISSPSSSTSTTTQQVGPSYTTQSSQNPVVASTPAGKTNNSPSINQTRNQPNIQQSTSVKPSTSNVNQSQTVAPPNQTKVQNTAPVPTTNFVASVQSSSAIHLSWNASPNVTTYNIMRSNASQYGPFNPIATSLSAISFDDTGLSASTTYYYDLYTVSNGGLTLIGNVSATTQASQVQSTTPPSTTYNIPTWIKNNAKWWSQGQMSDSDFTHGIQYLIQQKIIRVPPQNQTSSGAQQIPAWVKNTAGWWADGKMSDDDFLRGMEYLVQIGIIKV